MTIYRENGNYGTGPEMVDKGKATSEITVSQQGTSRYEHAKDADTVEANSRYTACEAMPPEINVCSKDQNRKNEHQLTLKTCQNYHLKTYLVR